MRFSAFSLCPVPCALCLVPASLICAFLPCALCLVPVSYIGYNAPMKIVLATLHAKYVHASLALPCLAASIADIDGIDTVIREFTVNEPPQSVLADLLEELPDIVAFSCYIWNVEQSLRIAGDLKKLLPSTLIIVGGPEVSFDAEELLGRNAALDCVIRGEGEQTWRELAGILSRGESLGANPESLPAGITWRSGNHILTSPDRHVAPDLDVLASPFASGLVDTAKPLVYCETSRGCPFSCAFCLSSIEKGVRSFSMARIRRDLQYLMDAKVQVVKLVDRTFNFDAGRADDIWEFILSQNSPCRFHFEIAADLLTERNLALLKRVPPGKFRFEIGVQATGKETLDRVNRTSRTDRLLANIRRLRNETGVTVHLDLIAGLPGEDLPGFLDSLQRLFPLHPHHIQVEPLKVLKGSPMVSIAAEEGYAYAAYPPYKILRTPSLSFHDITHIEELTRLLDVYYNSERFACALRAVEQTKPLSAFFNEMAFFTAGGTAERNLSLKNAFGILWDFVNAYLSPAEREPVRDALCYDFCMTDYPVTGKLPAFFETRDNPPSPPAERATVAQAVQQIQTAPGSRVRTFTHTFSRDYRMPAPPSHPVCLTFFYVAQPGKGLNVTVHALPPGNSAEFSPH